MAASREQEVLTEESGGANYQSIEGPLWKLFSSGQKNEPSDLGRGLNFLLHCAGQMELPGAMAQDRNYPSNYFLCFSSPEFPLLNHVAYRDAARQLHKPAHFYSEKCTVVSFLLSLF